MLPSNPALLPSLNAGRDLPRSILQPIFQYSLSASSEFNFRLSSFNPKLSNTMLSLNPSFASPPNSIPSGVIAIEIPASLLPILNLLADDLLCTLGSSLLLPVLCLNDLLILEIISFKLTDFKST